MRKPTMLILGLLAASLGVAPAAIGGESPFRPAPGPTVVREIYVPYADLNVLIEGQPRRVMLSRKEYEELLAKAKKRPDEHAPLPALLVSADTEATAGEQRVEMVTKLVVDVLDEGLCAVPLELGGVGLRKATLDGRPASIGRPARGGQPTLFVEGKGRHELVLDTVTPLQTTAAQQVATMLLPRPAAARMRLTVPGDVEIKSGADVASRVVDEKARVTRFELIPRTGALTLVMTLNSHLARQQRVVMAGSVVVHEITQAYERLHAAVSLEILHRAVDDFRFTVPDGFEVTDVNCPLLSRWNIVTEGKERILEVKLREQTTETVLLNVSAVRTPARLDAWEVPKLEPLDVVGQVTVVGLLVEDRLQARGLESKDLIRIDTDIPTRKAVPESVLRPAPGTPLLRPVVAYYAPQGGYELSGQFGKLPAEVAVTTNVLLVLSNQRQEALGGFAVLPAVEKLFGIDFTVPAAWHVEGVTGPDGAALDYEYYGPADGPGRVHVRLPQGVPPGQEYAVRFQATSTPAGWLDDWKSQKVVFPVFAMEKTVRDAGAIAVSAKDDLAVSLDAGQRLVPLDEAEKGRFNLSDVRTDLAYRYEGQPYHATLVARRTQPRVTAQTFSFLQIAPDALTAHYELIYQIDEARARELALLLPASAPTALSIRALDGVALKEYDWKKVGDQTRWTVRLAEPRRDRVRLAVDFQQPLSLESAKDVALPIVRAAGTGEEEGEQIAYQSGMVAVEGDAELDVEVTTDARAADVGELVDAEYQPGRRLLGAYRFVGDAPPVKVSVTREPAHAIYPAIVEKAELITLLAASGLSQTSAAFELRTKALFLEVSLPAKSTLWSAELDGQPIKPQRQGDSVLVSLPAGGDSAVRRLRIVYQTPVNRVALTGRLDLPAPQLALRSVAGATAEKVPLADLQWHLSLPSGYEVIRSTGTVVPERIERSEPAAVYVVGAAYYLAGGVPGPTYLLGPTIQAAREAASPMYVADDSRSMPAADKEGAPMGLGYQLEHGEGEEKPAEMMPTAEAEPEMPAEEAPDEEKLDALTTLETMAKDNAQLRTEVDALRDEIRSRTPERKPAEPRPPAATEPSAPPTTPPPPKPEPKDEQIKRAWKYSGDLQGVRSLQIELGQDPDAGGRVVTFQSLGEEPLLVVTLANRPRLITLGWAAALAVLLCGMAITRRRVGAKVRFVVVMAALATLVPVVPGLTALAEPANMVVFAAALLVPYYLLAGAVRWVVRMVGSACERSKLCGRGAATAALLVAAMLAGSATAEPPKVSIGPYQVELVTPPGPVTMPEDAIVLPYDPDSKTGVRDAKQVLVPYTKYAELWNRAYPDKKLETKAPPAPYALAGASYQTRLVGDEYLLVRGKMTVDVYSDGFVTVPLGLEGGVLAEAELDGRPAQISVPRIADAPVAQAAQQKKQAPGSNPIVLLQVSGKGPHELTLAVRLRLERHGGWRVASGTLPAAPASALAITVPDAQTEVRLSRVDDRTSYDTEKADEVIETALGAGGTMAVQWRPKVTEGQVDRSLTASGTATLDVQEDGLRLSWQLGLQFPRSQRERFTLKVPKEYLVEKVDGGNVRGWNVKEEADGQSVEVSLLKTAKDGESFSVQLWRKGPVGRGELETFDVPQVSVPDAALQNGQITIRRSPLLDVRVAESSGVSRTDLVAAAANKPRGDNSGEPSAETAVLVPVAFQAYRFVAMPFRIALVAGPVAEQVTAEVQSVLKIADYEQSLESRIRLSIGRRPLYRVEIFLPEGLSDEKVTAPARFQWAVTEVDKRRLLTIYLADHQQGELVIALRGKFEGRKAGDPVPLPVVELRDVARQQGDIAVQVDPAVNVEARDLKGCETVLLDRLSGWLNRQQQAITRLGIRYRSPGYSGTLVLSARKPEVTCTTVSSLRVTSRAVEETVLLDFRVLKAGIRQVEFLLPESMKEARIDVLQGLRQKTVEPAGDDLPGWVRVSIQLQDEIMGQLRVIVLHDRLLEQAKSYAAPIPVVETGRVERQFVTMQSLGRDEVIAGEPKGLEPLSRQQRQWKTLEGYGLGGITLAYVVVPGAKEPQWSFSTRPREVVRSAGATIGLAETDLVMDESGAYRAEQVYHVDNTTEQYLEIALPPDCRLWTAWVAGQPVKPTDVPQGTPPLLPGWTNVRIPLVKTAAGDLDYQVHLQYAGKMESLRNLRQTEFPLLRSVNIDVQRSHVRLHLPERYRWFDFGGTMGRVTEEADLAAQTLDYQTKQAERLVETLHESGSFARLRAASNLKQLGMAQHRSQEQLGDYESNEEFQQQFDKNADVLRQAQQEVEKIEAAPREAAQMDNRAQLNALFEGQRSSRARNVVQDAGGNWRDEDLNGQPAVPQSGKDMFFNDQWLDRNKLANPAMVPQGPGAMMGPEGRPQPGMQPGQGQGEQAGDRSGGGMGGGGQQAAQQGGTRIQYDAPQQQLQSNAQPQAAKIVGGKFKKQLEGLDAQQGKGKSQTKEDAEERYQRRLEQQQIVLQQQPLPGRYRADLDDAARDQQAERAKFSADRGRFTQTESGLMLDDADYGRPESPAVDGTSSTFNVGGEAAVASGLASLRVELPQRGTVYRFTTPGGDVAITARSVSDETIRSVLRVVVVLVALLLVGAVFRMGRRGRFDWLTSPTFSTLLIALGVASVLLGIFPAAGLVAVVVGICIKIQRAVHRRQAATA